MLEVGCEDAFGTRIVLQKVRQVTAVDFDPAFVKEMLTSMEKRWKCSCKVHNMLEGLVKGKFDGA